MPRPYECVRRTWHSDRHQPIRGSVIQEILRIALEVHGSSTKLNKEWQEKLPIVVFKVEEILYSRANSEAEYVDPQSLWTRSKEAINTIIRLDESTETGDLLQPCVEAALQLGCTPRRGSRGQQNSAPTCYLRPRNTRPNSYYYTAATELSNVSSGADGHSQNLPQVFTINSGKIVGASKSNFSKLSVPPESVATDGLACDLSLRLGSLNPPSLSVDEHRSSREDAIIEVDNNFQLMSSPLSENGSLVSATKRRKTLFY